MAMQNTVKLGRMQRHMRTALLVGVAGVGLAGGLALGVWQANRGAHHRAASVGHAAPVTGAALRFSPTAPFYVVRTPEQERDLRAWLALGVTGGADTAPPAAIIMAPSAPEADFASATMLAAVQAQFASSHAAAATAAKSANQHSATTVIIARTADEAQTLQAWLAAGDFGVPAGAPQNTSVVALQPQEAAWFRQTIADENARRASLGLAEVTLIDLNAPAAAVTRPSVQPAMSSVLVARTPEEEQTLRAWIAAGDFGVPGGAPSMGRVVVAGSPAEADFARGAMQNSLGDAGS